MLIVTCVVSYYYIYLLCVFMCVKMCKHTTACIRRPEDKYGEPEPVLSFHHVRTRDQTWDISRLCSKHFRLLSHLTGPFDRIPKASLLLATEAS